MSFKEIIGNDEIKNILSKQIENDKVVHSYLFVGIDGIGKKLFAREFARRILCMNKEKEENCESCIKWKARKSSRLFPNRTRKWYNKN